LKKYNTAYSVSRKHWFQVGSRPEIIVRVVFILVALYSLWWRQWCHFCSMTYSLTALGLLLVHWAFIIWTTSAMVAKSRHIEGDKLKRTLSWTRLKLFSSLSLATLSFINKRLFSERLVCAFRQSQFSWWRQPVSWCLSVIGRRWSSSVPYHWLHSVSLISVCLVWDLYVLLDSHSSAGDGRHSGDLCLSLDAVEALQFLIIGYTQFH